MCFVCSWFCISADPITSALLTDSNTIDIAAKDATEIAAAAAAHEIATAIVTYA